MARKSGFVRRNNVMRRATEWVGISEAGTSLVAANTAAIVNSGNVPLQTLAPFTIIRTRISWHCRSDQTGADEDYQVALGFAVVRQSAIAAGIASLPTPFTELGDDGWWLHHIITSRFEFVTGTGFNPDAGIFEHVDSKAMRRVSDGENIVMILENSSLGGGSDNLTAGRVLIKLH